MQKSEFVTSLTPEKSINFFGVLFFTSGSRLEIQRRQFGGNNCVTNSDFWIKNCYKIGDKLSKMV